MFTRLHYITSTFLQGKKLENILNIPTARSLSICLHIGIRGNTLKVLEEKIIMAVARVNKERRRDGGNESARISKEKLDNEKESNPNSRTHHCHGTMVHVHGTKFS